MNWLLIALVQFFGSFLFAKHDFRFEEVVDERIVESFRRRARNNKANKTVNGINIEDCFRKVLNFSRFLLEVEVPNISIVFS